MARSDKEGMVGGVVDGKYELTAHIRDGEFGDFWAAKRLEDDAEVAVRLFKPSLLKDEQAFKRFERETKLLSEWKHPGLLKVIDTGRTDAGVPWLCTEFQDGRPLSDDIADLALSVDRVCHIGGQIARVLAGAHARGIVHRGLSPDAIMLVRKGDDPDRVKVLDFGLAHLSDAGDAALTQVGQRLGRPEYWSPEYISLWHLDAKSDLYVLGLIIFEMLCGQPPFVGSKVRVLMKHVEEDPERPSDLSVLEVPHWLDELVVALLQKDPDDRPDDAMQVAKAFSFNIYPLNARRQ